MTSLLLTCTKKEAEREIMCDRDGGGREERGREGERERNRERETKREGIR